MSACAGRLHHDDIMSRAFTDGIMSRLQVPTPGSDERMGDVLVDTNKRPLVTSSDFVSSIMTGVQSKRRFMGDSGLGAFRDSLRGQLAEGLSVVNTGFSTTDAQSDEVISQPIYAKAFREAWHQDYVNETPLFCSRKEPETNSLQMYTVASPQVLNFGLELQSIKRTRALLNPGAAADFEETLWSLGHMMAESAADFGDKWNYLGPMTGFLDAGVHSSDASVRRAQNAERMLNFSIYNRARIFNFFGDNVVKGDYLFWCVKAYDVSRLKNFLDPRGHAVAARRQFPAHEMQVMGASSRYIHAPTHNSAYEPVTGPDSFTDPGKSDTDYTARIAKLATDFRPIDFDEYDRPSFRAMNDADAVAEAVRAVPELVYEAYLEGYWYDCRVRARTRLILSLFDTHSMKVGYARAKEGRNPTESALLEAHRSHVRCAFVSRIAGVTHSLSFAQEAMKRLQSLTIYHM